MLSAVGTLTSSRGIRGAGVGEVPLPRRAPPSGLPLPRLPWLRSPSILTPPSSVPAAWAPAFRAFSLECSKTRQPLRKSHRNLPVVLAAGRAPLPPVLESDHFHWKIATLQVKSASPASSISREMHLSSFLGSRVSFSSLLEAALSWEADIPRWRLPVQKAPAA